MRLVSINVGQPRTITWQGRRVRSAIWKEPVGGRRRVGALNVDGDAQADLTGHGGEHRAVFVYQLDSYRYWERQLGRSLADFGQFGENFTVDGLADDDVCVGDRFTIGSALFEVTQPRVTCYKVGIRLGEPRMPALLTGHGRPGFYLRVLREGEVGAGDEIVRAADGRHGLSVERISAALYTPDFDEAILRSALDNPALSDGWKWSFRQLLEQRRRGAKGNSGLSAAPHDPPAYTGFRRLTVADDVRETAGVRSLLLVPADNEQLPPHRPGQFVTVRVTGADGAALVRSYSISAPAGGRSIRISVKRDGQASAFVHDRLTVGDEIEAGAPRGAFVLEPGDGPVALISAGIGATPLLAMLGALADHRSDREVTWVHVARSRAEHAFAEETRRLLAQLPRGVSHVRYTQPGPDDLAGRDFDAAGRLGRDDLVELGISPQADAYVCGPAGFMDAISGWLGELGVDRSRVHTEAFGAMNQATGARPHSPIRAPIRGHLVSFARSGVSVRFDADRWRTLLELAEECDVPASWSCRTGVCHRCESGVISGAVSYDPEPLDPPAPGNALLCTARPIGDVTLDL